MKQHSVLGELTVKSYPSSGDEFEAEIQYFDRCVKVRIAPDGHPPDVGIAFAADAISKLDVLISKARKAAVHDLLNQFNNDWSNGKTLTADEFSAMLNIEAVSVVSTSNVEIWFDDKKLFAGHSIFVSFISLKPDISNLDEIKGTAEYFG